MLCSSGETLVNSSAGTVRETGRGSGFHCIVVEIFYTGGAASVSRWELLLVLARVNLDNPSHGYPAHM